MTKVLWSVCCYDEVTCVAAVRETTTSDVLQSSHMSTDSLPPPVSSASTAQRQSITGCDVNKRNLRPPMNDKPSSSNVRRSYTRN